MKAKAEFRQTANMSKHGAQREAQAREREMKRYEAEQRTIGQVEAQKRSELSREKHLEQQGGYQGSPGPAL